MVGVTEREAEDFILTTMREETPRRRITGCMAEPGNERSFVGKNEQVPSHSLCQEGFQAARDPLAIFLKREMSDCGANVTKLGKEPLRLSTGESVRYGTLRTVRAMVNKIPHLQITPAFAEKVMIMDRPNLLGLISTHAD